MRSRRGRRCANFAGLVPAPGPLIMASEGFATAGAMSVQDVQFGQLTAPRTVRALARANQRLRTSSHAIGLVEGLESLVLGTAVDLAGPDAFIRPELLRPKPVPPAGNQTAIELPWRLVLSPSRDGAWFHSPDAVEGENGRTELWHTRLGSRQNGDIPRVDPKRVLRAIWAISPPGNQQVTTPTDPTDVDYLPPEINDDPYRTSLNEYDRHSVVHLSSNFRLRKPPPLKGFFEPTPLEVDHMALSSLGGWLDSRGAWDDQPLGLKVEEWRHRATSGVTTSCASSTPAGFSRLATERRW